MDKHTLDQYITTMEATLDPRWKVVDWTGRSLASLAMQVTQSGRLSSPENTS
jgi:hypothetical protein